MSDEITKAKQILDKVEECLVLSGDFKDEYGTNNCLRMTRLVVTDYLSKLEATPSSSQ